MIPKRQKLEAKEEADQGEVESEAPALSEFGDFPALPPGLRIQTPQVSIKLWREKSWVS